MCNVHIYLKPRITLFTVGCLLSKAYIIDFGNKRTNRIFPLFELIITKPYRPRMIFSFHIPL